MLSHAKLFILSNVVVTDIWCGFCGMVLTCCCPLVLSVTICFTLATCLVPNACPLPFTLCPLLATGLVWPCWVLQSFCLRHLLWFCGMVLTCVAALVCYLLPFAALWQLALCPDACPLHPTLCPCLMSLALGGPVRFYLLFVSGIWCGLVAWC